MHIVYYDESGDDGYPAYSSEIFVLSALYLHYLNWKDSYNHIKELRRRLKNAYKFPIKTEMHCKSFLLNKWPYRDFDLCNNDRVEIIKQFCELIAELNIEIISIAIVKTRIHNPNYDVLDTALKYSVQRIENDMNLGENPNNRFMIITDPGRVGKMRKTTRKIQRINYIPSVLHPGTYRKEIDALIEDPMQKDSKESYFIQLCDIVAYLVYLYALKKTGVAKFHNRLLNIINEQIVLDFMEIMKPSLNLKASANDVFGVKFHPE